MFADAAVGWRAGGTAGAERQTARRRISRNDALRDAGLQAILPGIDEAMRAILPAYCA